MANIKINLPDNGYHVHVGCSLERIGSRMKGGRFGKKVLILSDKNVFPLYGETVKKSAREAGKEVSEMILPPGEGTKNFQEVYRIIETCGKNRMGRDDTLLTLGGGVASDTGGFAASIYMRGMNFAAVPTTLLAQVDAAIGGKTGVNLPFGKNLAGSFYQPSFVYIDINTLNTLPGKEIKQGLAEIIKYGVIRSRKIFSIMENGRGGIEKEYRQLIMESVKIKRDVVEKDEKEKKGLREILNFGHTLGHAIEISHFPLFSHGEAVALGMAGESFMGMSMGICGRETYCRIKEVIRQFGLPCLFSGIRINEAFEYLGYDKKVRQGKIRFVLPEKIGSVRRGIAIPLGEVEKMIKESVKNEKSG